MDLNILTVGTSVNIKRSNGNTVCAIFVIVCVHCMHTPCTIHHMKLIVCTHTHTHTHTAHTYAGRVHSAAVSSVDKETNYVSVEWYENDETKGKEVSMNHCFHLSGA